MILQSLWVKSPGKKLRKAFLFLKKEPAKIERLKHIATADAGMNYSARMPTFSVSHAGTF